MTSLYLSRARLRFWLHAMNVANWLDDITHGRCRRIYLWAVGKASDSIDWGPALSPDGTPDPWESSRG